ncbi:hypothetical protein Pfo_002820 [Paulownia fortunei]|nr:hypothetical protein Pfo_002820 [Paulownia fortunei]
MSLQNVFSGGITSSFVRKVEESVDMPLYSDVFRVPPGYNAPQQVHITQGDHVGKAVTVSWVTTAEPGSNTVLYWSENNNKRKLKAEGILTTYKFYNYTSGYIHHCTLDNLQTYDSNSTLTHYESNPTKGEAVLFVGDLSYADKYPNHDNTRWDTWGMVVERSNAYQPWIWTAGNHDVDFAPEIGEPEP